MSYALLSMIKYTPNQMTAHKTINSIKKAMAPLGMNFSSDSLVIMGKAIL